jgi:hypothetical protein
VDGDGIAVKEGYYAIADGAGGYYHAKTGSDGELEYSLDGKKYFKLSSHYVKRLKRLMHSEKLVKLIFAVVAQNSPRAKLGKFPSSLDSEPQENF